MKILALSVCLLTGSATLPAWAQSDAGTGSQALELELRRLAQAQHLQYRALLILSTANQLSTVRVSPDQARADGALPKTLISSPQTLQLDTANLPSFALQRRGWHTAPSPTTNLAQLQRAYQIQMLALDQIDGRTALPLRFNPVDRWRYGTTLWVDRSTGLVVKTEVRSTDGQTLAQTMLAELEVIDSAQAPAADANAPAASVPPMHWRIQGLPEGFAVLASAPGSEGEQLVVSDGVASVSVFVEPLGAGQVPQRGQQQRGLLSSQAEVRGDYQLIAIGAVPPHTIERILNGVTPAE